MGRYLLLFILVIAGYINIDARQPLDRKSNRHFVASPPGTTTMYLVRHAEKNTSDPKNEDPDLTEAGQKRARDLQAFLKEVQIDAFFSTPYKRTQQTITPIAQGQPILYYEAHNYDKLRQQVLTGFKGKTVLIVGHSNTLLPLIEAFGGKRPIAQIADNQYDNIFRLTVSPKGKVSVQAKKFGTLSEQTSSL